MYTLPCKIPRQGKYSSLSLNPSSQMSVWISLESIPSLCRYVSFWWNTTAISVLGTYHITKNDLEQLTKVFAFGHKNLKATNVVFQI